MIERDYIMRMVTQLTRALARILFLKKEEQFPEAVAEIDATGRTLLGVDLAMMRLFSQAQLLQLFGKDDTLEIPKCYVLGVLLKEEADLMRLQGDGEQSKGVALKALSLLTETYLRHGEVVEPDHISHVDFAIDLLAGTDLPPEIMAKVFRFYAAIGRYDKAEDALFDLLTLDSSYLPEGLRFYQDLLEKTDDNLQNGNLPRDEVIQALEDLQARKSQP